VGEKRRLGSIESFARRPIAVFQVAFGTPNS
jgi:hypothetical protein